MWNPRINDPSIKYLSPNFDKEVYLTTVQMIEMKSFLLWKAQCIKYKNNFIRIIDSDYIYCVLVDSFDVIGIWDINNKIGYKTKFLKFQNLSNLRDLFLIIPDNQLDLNNKEVFNYTSTEQLKEITKYSKDLFTKFLLDSNYKNVPKEVLAVKAIKASHSFYQSIEDYTKVYFSAKVM